MDHLSSANLFSEMEMDDAVFVNEWMGTLDNFVQFCPNNNPFFPPSSTDNNGFDQTQNSDDVIHKPVMMNTVQRQPSASPSSNSFISFANSDGGFENPKAPVMKMDKPSGKTMISFMPSQDCGDHDNDEHRLNLVRKTEFGAGKRGSAIRSPLQAQYHVLAERKRRQKLTQRFISLSALIPGRKKLDKASVLGDAIKYIKELQERVRTLEVDQEQTTRSGNKESTLGVKRERVSGHDEDSSSLSDDGSYEAGTAVALPEIEVRASGENLLIRVHCNKLGNHGVVIKEILSEIERLHLTINTSHVMPFGNTTYITIAAQMNREFNMEAKDVADNIRTTIVKLICHGELR